MTATGPDRITSRRAKKARKSAEELRRRRTGLGIAAFVLLAVMIGAIGHVWVRMKAVETAYALGQGRKENMRLIESRRKLRIEIGSLEDPRRVLPLAREKLGMAPPTPENIQVVALAEGVAP